MDERIPRILPLDPGRRLGTPILAGIRSVRQVDAADWLIPSAIRIASNNVQTGWPDAPPSRPVVDLSGAQRVRRASRWRRQKRG